MSDKALQACMGYVHWHGEIKRLTRAIGNSIRACITEREGESHLSDIYRGYDDDGDPFSGPSHCYYTEEETVEHLKDTGCAHCLAAHYLIQERKTARKKWGAAKRYIGKLGRAASAEFDGRCRVQGGNTNNEMLNKEPA
jgi:hypothetical protein